MAYVDLNPIRAKVANTPKTSKHTSIQKRLESTKQPTTHSLMPFVGNPRQDMPKGIAFSLKDYCELVDITGRIIRNYKAGHIDHQQHPILQRLGLSDEQQSMGSETEVSPRNKQVSNFKIIWNIHGTW